MLWCKNRCCTCIKMMPPHLRNKISLKFYGWSLEQKLYYYKSTKTFIYKTYTILMIQNLILKKFLIRKINILEFINHELNKWYHIFVWLGSFGVFFLSFLPFIFKGVYRYPSVFQINFFYFNIMKDFIWLTYVLK